MTDNSDDHPPPTKRIHLDESLGVVSATETVTPVEFKVPDQDSPQHILNSLNDFCLQEIFRRIKIVDLSSVAEVCTRFKRNAEQIFLLFHEKRFRFVSLTMVKVPVFRNFVHLIKSVYLNGSDADQCLSHFSERCLIESLHLRGAHIDVEKLKPLLGKLTTLEISSCVVSPTDANPFLLCSKLRNLKFKLTNVETFRPCRIPTLQKFEFDDYTYSETLRSFIEANPQLSFISVATVNNITTPIDFNPTAPHNFDEHLRRFGDMKSLTSLKLPCFRRSVRPLMNSLCTNNVPIENLELKDCQIDDEAFRHILQLKSIQILSVTGIDTLSCQQFMDLANELPQLEVLRLETVPKCDLTITVDDIQRFVQSSKKIYLLTIGIIRNVTIDQDWYTDLLSILSKNRNRKTLNITFIYGNSMTIKVSKQTLMKCKDQVRIVGVKLDPFSVTVNYENEGGSDDDGDTDDSDESSESEDSESDFGEISDFDSIIGSADESEYNSDDSWMHDVYEKD